MMTKTWMVGKVEAPAKANRIELKAEKHPLGNPGIFWEF